MEKIWMKKMEIHGRQSLTKLDPRNKDRQTQEAKDLDKVLPQQVVDGIIARRQGCAWEGGLQRHYDTHPWDQEETPQ